MPSTHNLWQQALASLELELDSAIVSTWFRNTKLYETTENKLIVACTDAYSKSIIQRKYANRINEIIKGLAKKKLTLEFVVRPSKVTSPITGPLFDQASNRNVNQDLDSNLTSDLNSGIAQPFDQLPESTQSSSTSSTTQPSRPPNNQDTSVLNPDLTLDNFVVGVSNRVVHAATVSVIENPGSVYNPLFVYGATGVGKTHLLHAVGNAILQQNPGFNILYAPTERFVNDMIGHIIQKKSMDKFRQYYRPRDVLLIDDVQFLTGKEACQEEFYHTFNELHQSSRQIVLASDRPPAEIKGLTDRLISRFKGGLMVQITPPDYETRLAIVKTKADQYGLGLNLSMCQYIAEHSNQNIREIQGVLQQIHLLAGSQNGVISFGIVKSVLEPEAAEKKPPKKITPELVLDLVRERFETSMKDLCGRRRTKEIVIPRQMAMFLLRNELGMNFEDVGEILGGRDHTTVMHGCEKVRSEIEDHDNNILRAHLNAIRQDLYA